MGLVAVTETAQMFQQKNIVLTERDKEFVVQFAFRTNDRELTNKLVDELAAAGADRDAVCRNRRFIPESNTMLRLWTGTATLSALSRWNAWSAKTGGM